MIRKSVKRFSHATNAERVCAKIMHKARGPDLQNAGGEAIQSSLADNRNCFADACHGGGATGPVLSQASYSFEMSLPV
jgi:hypothetical protein